MTVVGLCGTRFKAHPSAPVVQTQTGAHWVLQAGHLPSQPITHRCAGVSLLVSKRWFTRRQMVRIATPPVELGGRGLAVELRHASAHLLLIVAYFAPKVSTASARPAYLKCSGGLVDWVAGQVAQAPWRCAPVILTDLNDGLGGFASTAVGPVRLDSGGPVAERFARMLEDHHLVAYNTFHDCGHAFFGSSSSNRIDFIAGSRGWLPRVQHTRAQHRRSRLLQLIPSPWARNHVVLSLSLLFGECPPHFRPVSPPSPLGSRARLVLSARW